jgi:cytochrome c peroxidase
MAVSSHRAARLVIRGLDSGGNLFERPGVFHRLGRKQAKDPRVPSLRNVAVTAPYFHDGSASTLDRAVRSRILGELLTFLHNRHLLYLIDCKNLGA